MMAVAAIDRLVHHATILEMGGESYRMKESVNSNSKRSVVRTYGIIAAKLLWINSNSGDTR
jgi:hypothetical protein